MLNKSNLDLAIIAKNNFSNGGGILINKDVTVANDGRILIEVTRPQFNPEEFPSIPNFEVKENGDFILPANEALKISSKIPNKKKDNPILKNAVIEQGERRVRIASTDLDSVSITDCNKIEGTYPEYKEVIPEGKLNHRIGVNPKYLMEICKLADKFQSEEYKIMVMEFNDSNSALKLTTVNLDTKQEFTAVLMPIDLRKESEEEEDKEEEDIIKDGISENALKREDSFEKEEEAREIQRENESAGFKEDGD